MNLQLLMAYKCIVVLGFLYGLWLCIAKKVCSIQRYFFAYLFTVVLFDVFHITDLMNCSKTHGYQFYAFFSMAYFTYFFSSQLRNKSTKKLVFVLGCVFLLAGFFFQNQNGWQILSGSLLLTNAITMIVFAIIWLFSTLNPAKDESILTQFTFWVSAALLFWGSFFIFRSLTLYYFHVQDRLLSLYMTNLLTVINIITYTLFIFGLYLLHKNEKA